MISYRRIFFWLAFVIALFILQTSFFPIFSWNGVSVNLMLVLTVSWSLLYGARRGAFLGFMTGFLQDLTTGMFFGMDVFALTIIGYATGAFSRNVFKDPVFLPAMSTMWATAAHYFLVLVLMLLLGYGFSLLYVVKRFAGTFFSPIPSIARRVACGRGWSGGSSGRSAAPLREKIKAPCGASSCLNGEIYLWKKMKTSMQGACTCSAASSLPSSPCFCCGSSISRSTTATIMRALRTATAFASFLA